MTRAEQDQHVAEFMKSHGAERTDVGHWYIPTLGYFSPAQATFMWRTAVEAQQKIWRELKSGEGFYTNKDGCREIHLDYILERLDQLDRLLETEGE